MDEAVSGGGAEVSQRAGKIGEKAEQAEERLRLGGQQPLGQWTVLTAHLFSLLAPVYRSGLALGQVSVCLCVYFSMRVFRLHISLAHKSGASSPPTLELDLTARRNRIRLIGRPKQACLLLNSSANPLCFKQSPPFGL